MFFSKVASLIVFSVFSAVVHAASLVDSIPIPITRTIVNADKSISNVTTFQNSKIDTCEVKSGGDRWCSRTYTEDEVLSDFKASPTLAEGGEIKLGLARMELDLGTNLRIPFAIVVADVTSQTKSDQANAIKLLDPQQGINIGLEYAWQYRIGNVCSTEGSTATCVIGVRGGGRYVSLKEDVTDDSQDTYGAFVTIENAWAFKIYKYNTNEETGYLRLNAAGSYFNHNGVDSDAYFSGIKDPSGNPIKFENSYYSTTLSAALFITKSINISYTKWKSHGSNGLTDQDTVSINFDILKIGK